jgi:hypothetical protein
MLPNRNDKQYTDVEKFKEYELTNNIAYEMVIRNSEVQKIIKDFLKQFIENEVSNYTPVLDTLDFKEADEAAQQLLKTFRINPLQLYLEYNFLSDIIEELKRIQDELSDTQKIIVNSILFKAINDDYRNEYTKNTTEENRTKILDVVTTSFYENTFVYQEEDKEKGLSKTILRKDIKPIFTVRPQLHIDFDIAKIRDVEINFSLPKNEILSFIEYLYDDVKKNPLNTPLELLSIELDEDNNTLDKKINTKLIFSKQHKLANMFYVYDCLKLNATQKTIRENIYNYYYNKDNTTSTAIDYKTIKNYKEIAKCYIDNLKYKELIVKTN